MGAGAGIWMNGWENKEFVKKVYRSSVEGPNRRGRPLGREDRVKKYMSEKGVRENGLERWTLKSSKNEQRDPKIKQKGIKGP